MHECPDDGLRSPPVHPFLGVSSRAICQRYGDFVGTCVWLMDLICKESQRVLDRVERFVTGICKVNVNGVSDRR
jgi:hypothetical protein